ncbi:hypothetical protein B0T11DRAFT_323921 [Plectosphaerella cucumerina]|uniref:Uncharacterized protein n=1 Tax=Plectosphaerella cucumerina TaxID=40658 RepID=A0A8K0X936_9PEZI|nr:hypothetical protein B0T11DRAFT_323921 [Plectosphaerella cucumerina]
MGAVCGKEKPNNFSSPGRPVGSAPVQPKTAPVPNKPAPRVGGPPRTLGGGSDVPSSADRDDQRRRAAEAAEARAKAANKASGKLGAQLAAQKKQTNNDRLNELSNENRLHREADAKASVIRND